MITYRFLFSAFFSALASTLFFMSLAVFSVVQASDAEIKSIEMAIKHNKHFEVISTYTGIDILQGKPLFLPKNDVILITNRKQSQDRSRHGFIDSTKDIYTIDAIDISDIHKPVFLKTLIKFPTGVSIQDFVVTEDEQQLFVITWGRLLSYDISDLESTTLKSTIIMSTGWNITLSNNNDYLFVPGCIEHRCKSITVFKLTPYPEFFTELNANGNANIVISKDSKKLAYNGRDGSRLILASISTSFKVKTLDSDYSTYNNRGSWKTSAAIEEVVFSDDGNSLYIAGNQGGVLVYDISDNKLDKIQQTAGIHWGGLFNNTSSIYSLDMVNDTLYIAGRSARKKISDKPKIKKTKNAFYFSGITIKALPGKNIIMVYDNKSSHPKSGYITFMQPIKEEHRIQEIDN